MAPRPTYLLVARRNGPGADRRSRRFLTRDARRRAVQAWRAEGYQLFWCQDGSGQLHGPLR